MSEPSGPPPGFDASLQAARRSLGRLLPPAWQLTRPARRADVEALAAAVTPGDHPVPPPAAVAAMIDHTLLRPDAAHADVEHLCAEAREHGFGAVCVHPRFVPVAARATWGSRIRVCSVIGFPFGATPTILKVLEAELAIEQGARELDMVLPLGALKAGALDEVGIDIAGVVAVAHAAGVLVKVILETGMLSPAEQVTAALLARGAAADFVKTSTGFIARGAEAADVRRLRAVVGPVMGVKASGGIRTRARLEEMIRAGADRIGTSSGVAIMREYPPAASGR